MKAKAKLLALPLLVAVLTATAPAAPVTYWFTGVVTSVNNSSNIMPFEVSVGTPFAAQLSYETSLVGFSNLNNYPGGDIGFYYFTNTAGFSMIFQIAGHTITNTTRLGRNCGSVGVYDQYNNEDSYWSDTGNLTVDGSPFLADPDFSVISIYLSDSSKTAFDSVAIPTNAPNLNSFSNHRDLIWGAYIDDGNPTQLFSITGVFTEISSTEKVLLNCRPLSADTVQLGWPVTVSGFSLESITDLTSTNWQTVPDPVVDINTEHTVTVPNSGPGLFYRLKK